MPGYGPNRCRLELTLTPDLKARLSTAARARHLTMASASRMAIEAFIATTVADLNENGHPRRDEKVPVSDCDRSAPTLEGADARG